MPSLLRMHARSSARQLWRNMSAAATAPGYWRICNSPDDFPSKPSRPSSTYSSSRRTAIKDGDHRSMAVAETAERTARGRTSRRQRFVVASVGAWLRRFWPARGARPERADVGARADDFVSGDYRREGMGAPGIGDRSGSTDCFTASAIPWTPEPCEFGALFDCTRARARRFRVCDTRKRNQPGKAVLTMTRVDGPVTHE